jgi:hypothetical protein
MSVLYVDVQSVVASDMVVPGVQVEPPSSERYR